MQSPPAGGSALRVGRLRGFGPCASGGTPRHVGGRLFQAGARRGCSQRAQGACPRCSHGRCSPAARGGPAPLKPKGLKRQAIWAWPTGPGPEVWPRELAKGSSQEIWMIDLDDLGVWPSNRFLSAPPGNGALRRWLHSVRGTRLLTVPVGRRIRRTARQVPSRGGALLSDPTANKTPQLRADQHLSVTRDGAPANEDAWRNAQWRS